MRKLTFLVTLFVLAAIGWGTYWYIGARAMEGAYQAWLADRRAEGWVAEAEVKTDGLPNRFDTSFTGLQLADPYTGTAWSAPLFQIMSLSYKPNHAILYWPGEQSIALPDQSLTLTSDDMRGSLHVEPNPSLPLVETVVELQNGAVASTKGWQASLDHAQIAMRPRPEADPAAHLYDVAVSLDNLSPGETFLNFTRDLSGLPDVIEGAEITAQIAFDRDWDRRALESRRPQPVRINLDTLTAQWGGMQLTATGTLDIDANGQPSGKIDISATHWRDMLVLARATGAIGPEHDAALTRGLNFIAALSDNPEVLDLPLTFKNGITFIGPVPLGAAPVIALP
jgi:hypothetical protein